MARLAAAVPPSAGYRVCDLLGDVFYLCLPDARVSVRANLSHVLGRSPTPALVRAVFRHGARNYYDTLRIPGVLGAIDRLVRVRGWEHLDDALRQGRGAVLVGAHVSSVALAAQVLAYRGYPVVSVVERAGPGWLFDAVTELRAALGVRLLPFHAGILAELQAALRRNEVVALMGDRDVTGTGILVPFFGAPAPIPRGPAVLSLRTGAPMLAGLVVRDDEGGFQGVIEPVLAPSSTRGHRVDVERVTRKVVERFEYHISQAPEQWTVFQRVWPEEAA